MKFISFNIFPRSSLPVVCGNKKIYSLRVIARSVMLASMFALAACDRKTEIDEEIPKSETVDVLYEKALESFRTNRFKDAIDKFEEVERQYPYSEWAPRAELMAAFSGFRAGQFDDAISILDRFVKLHPTDKSTPYAYYLKAICYYTQISDVGRDQSTTELAREALRDLIARYPDSEYARDAKLKLDLTDDHLAGKDMEVGRYYQQQQEYISAIKRFQYVVNNYQTTSHVAEALHRLVECYLRLGVVDEAKKYAAVLGHNFPDSDWYRYSYEMLNGNLSPEEKKSFIERNFKR